jgi:hypothetical protein
MTIAESERVIASVLRECSDRRALVPALAAALRDACAETRRDCARVAKDHGACAELVEAILPARIR